MDEDSDLPPRGARDLARFLFANRQGLAVTILEMTHCCK